MFLLGYALAALIGLSLGLMGGGGSILTVPIFVYVLGFDPKQAIVMSLPVVGVTSFVGALAHWRSGNINLRTAALFGVVAMAGAYLGARLAVYLNGAVQLSLLAVVMLVAAVSMFRSVNREPMVSTDATAGDTMSIALLVPTALGVGLMTGIVGIGGGFLVVPALVLLGRVPIKQAVGTSLLVIAMNCASGYVGYIGQVVIPRRFLVGFTFVAVLGIIAGTYMVRYVSQRSLKRAFAIFLVLMGAFILVKNRKVFSPSLRASAAIMNQHTPA
ncbi:MAG: sulfite exporter TauE/SafE family protein [bacterium]